MIAHDTTDMTARMESTTTPKAVDCVISSQTRLWAKGMMLFSFPHLLRWYGPNYPRFRPPSKQKRAHAHFYPQPEVLFRALSGPRRRPAHPGPYASGGVLDRFCAPA